MTGSVVAEDRSSCRQCQTAGRLGRRPTVDDRQSAQDKQYIGGSIRKNHLYIFLTKSIHKHFSVHLFARWFIRRLIQPSPGWIECDRILSKGPFDTLELELRAKTRTFNLAFQEGVWYIYTAWVWQVFIQSFIQLWRASRILLIWKLAIVGASVKLAMINQSEISWQVVIKKESWNECMTKNICSKAHWLGTLKTNHVSSNSRH